MVLDSKKGKVAVIGSTPKAPAITPQLPRQRKKSKTEIREAARLRSAAYRARREKQLEQSEKIANPSGGDLSQASAETMPTSAGVAAVAEQDKTASIEKVEEQVRQALSATIEICADGYAELWMEKNSPRFGEKRSDAIADVWSPIIAPHMKNISGALIYIVAGGVTAKQLLSWGHEVKKAAEAAGGNHGRPREEKREDHPSVGQVQVSGSGASGS